MSKTNNKKFLVILPYPSGMGHQILHVLDGLVCAYVTNRIPIVHWNERCLYYDKEENYNNNKNLFEYYFKPISKYCLKDLIGKGYHFYPEIWSEKNIENNSISLRESQRNQFSFPPTEEAENADVLVMAHRIVKLYEQMESIKSKNHNIDLLPKRELYNQFYSEYFKVSERIEQKVNEFYIKNFEGNKVIGIHIRKTDKLTARDGTKAPPFDYKYIKAINDYLSLSPKAKIFIASDSEQVIKKFEKRYKNQLIYTDSIRSNNSDPIHLKKDNNTLKGEQILIDIYLLSKCDHFIRPRKSSSIIPHIVTALINNPPSQGTTFINSGFFEELIRKTKIKWIEIKSKVRNKIKSKVHNKT